MVDVEQYLQEKGIEYKKHEHPAVFTCEEADSLCHHIPGIPGKNLFLKNKKKTCFFLFILPAFKQADLKYIAELVGEPKVSFASPESLMEKLGLKPGSVSPFGLLNNDVRDVEVYLDQDIADADTVNFHPNDNRASLELTQEMFQKYLALIPHTIHTIKL